MWWSPHFGAASGAAGVSACGKFSAHAGHRGVQGGLHHGIDAAGRQPIDHAVVWAARTGSARAARRPWHCTKEGLRVGSVVLLRKLMVAHETPTSSAGCTFAGLVPLTVMLLDQMTLQP